MRGPIAGLMQQAQKMQEAMKQAQEDLAKLEVTGQAGGGMVKVHMNGKYSVRRVEIEANLVGDDREMLEDMIAAATNDAVNRVAEASSSRMSEITAGMPLPPGMKFPF